MDGYRGTVLFFIKTDFITSGRCTGNIGNRFIDIGNSSIGLGQGRDSVTGNKVADHQAVRIDRYIATIIVREGIGPVRICRDIRF